METRRQFLGRIGEGAGMGGAGEPASVKSRAARLLRMRAEVQRRRRRQNPPAAALCSEGEAGDLSASCRAGRRRWTCSTTSRIWLLSTTRTCRIRFAAPAVDGHDGGPGALSHRSVALDIYADMVNPGLGQRAAADHRADGRRSTIIKSMNTDAINHEPAIMLMNTGNMNAGKPCLGSWLPMGSAA